MESAVELKNITKRFGKRVIFENFSLTIQKGEMVAVVGPSGCGKSTLLNMIGLLEGYDRGQIYILGRKLPKITSNQAMKLRRNTINYLFQSFALINDMSVHDNLLLAMKFVNISQNEKNKRIREVLNQVGLLSHEQEMVHTLSGGEQQRVALARTILKPGDIVLADEPTGALDPKSADIAFGLIRELCLRYQKTVIMVTHSMELASQTDRMIDLRYENFS